MLERKRFTPQLKASGPDGSVTAVFATLNVLDRHRDVTLPGAFGKQDVRIQPDGHDTWRPSIGKGEIHEDGETAVFEGLFNLAMESGREHFEAIKFDLEHGQPLQEWSYIFDVEEAGYEERDGAQIRLLKRLKVYSVDPVFLGAGIGTRTTGAKRYEGAAFLEHVEGVVADAHELLERVKSRSAVREKDGRSLSSGSRETLAALAESLKASASELEALLKMGPAEPGNGEELEAALARARKTMARLNGVAA